MSLLTFFNNELPFKWVFLWTDGFLYAATLLLSALAFHLRKYPHLRRPWQQVGQSPKAMASLVILMAFLITGLLDSVHFQEKMISTAGTPVYYSTQARTLLDWVLSPLDTVYERTYSRPFDHYLLNKNMVILPNGKLASHRSRLIYVHPTSKGRLIIQSIISATLIESILLSIFLGVQSKKQSISCKHAFLKLLKGQTTIAWRSIFCTTFGLMCVSFICFTLAQHYHILGTDKVGQDVFYASVKSIRTGIIIGSLTLFFMIPFAVSLGVCAGYFGGWIDDIIQFIYTTLSSVPSVLLIASAVLSLQVFVAKHADAFPTLLERADIQLIALCLILGITSWTPLCRMVRGSTLKLREIEFIEAARALGVSRPKILTQHILPHLMPIILITAALDFSGLVLAEAILSYVGVGVDPTLFSWGNMLNSGRLELARSPVVWWPVCGAFIFMFIFVLSANLLAETIRDAFDPLNTNTTPKS